MSQTAVHPENEAVPITIYELLNELRSYKNLDVYVTGSNSKMLSVDIVTEFRGRASQIQVFPFPLRNSTKHPKVQYAMTLMHI